MAGAAPIAPCFAFPKSAMQSAKFSSARLRLAPRAPRSWPPSLLRRPARNMIRAAAGAEGGGNNPRQAELQGSDEGDHGRVEGEQHTRATAVKDAARLWAAWVTPRLLNCAHAALHVHVRSAVHVRSVLAAVNLAAGLWAAQGT